MRKKKMNFKEIRGNKMKKWLKAKCIGFIIVSLGASLAMATPNRSAVCEDMWSKTLRFAKVGSYEVYEVNTTFKGPQYKQESQSVVKNTTKKVEQDTITYLVETTTQNGPTTKNENILTKKVFIENCGKGFTPGDGTSVEILEERNENLTVKLGTFLCKFQKMKVKTSRGEGITNHWITELHNGHPLMIKNTFAMPMQGNSSMTMVRELVDYKE
jgi:hypothetical protein